MPDNETQPEPNWQQFVDGLNKLNENITGLRGEVKAPPKEPDDEDEPPATPAGPTELSFPEGFDEMPPRQQFKWLVDVVGKDLATAIVSQVSEIIKPIQQQQVQNSQSVLEERYTREILGLMEEKGEDGKLVRPDFRDWGEEMQRIAGELPGITPERAYRMARSDNPKKAKELDTKYNPPPPPKPSPFSFAPNAGGSSAPTASPKAPDKQQAFANAMEKVQAKWGDQFALGQREF
jgi:hypothetical protein